MRFYYSIGRRSTVKICFILLAGLSLFILMFGCRKKNGDAGTNRPDEKSILSDKPLAAFQNELLDIAFKTAASIPVKPHIKDRSKAQEAVVAVCLRLDQPKRALEFTKKIDNWRRGYCYADLAFYLAQHGDVNVQHYLNLAGEIAEDPNIGETSRRDRIRVKIAKTHILLGRVKEANEFETGVVDSETGKVAGIRAMVSNNDSFNEQMKMLDALIASGIFDTVKNSLESATELFNRFYEDTEKRALVEDKIKSSWNLMPIFVRIDLLSSLAGFAADHGDNSKAHELINEAQILVDGLQWPPENHITITAKLIKLRCKSGDMEKAKACADSALALFKDKKDAIINIHRAGVLRPLAEAYQLMGNKDAALSVYKQAVEEGTVNINSRPRAQDLSATCCSMALYAAEPDAELWTRIRQVNEALGGPW